MPSSPQLDKKSSSTDKNHKANISLLKQRISRSTYIKVGLVALVVAVIICYLFWDLAFHGPLMSLLTNHDKIVALVKKVGPLGPLVYILLQILQTVVAPIPGQVVGSIGGFLFGGWGILWTTIGSLVGFWLVFLISRHFGRPLVEKIFKKSAVEKFDFIINSKSAPFILFAIFLLPGFPDDIVCYIAGLTKLPIKQLMLIATIGRLPTIILTNYLGAGLSDNLPMVIVAALAGTAILGFFAWKREKIISYLKRDESSKTSDGSSKTDSSNSGTTKKPAE